MKKFRYLIAILFIAGLPLMVNAQPPTSAAEAKKKEEENSKRKSTENPLQPQPNMPNPVLSTSKTIPSQTGAPGRSGNSNVQHPPGSGSSSISAKQEEQNKPAGESNAANKGTLKKQPSVNDLPDVPGYSGLKKQTSANDLPDVPGYSGVKKQQSANNLPDVPGYNGVKPTLNKTTSTNELPTPGYSGVKPTLSKTTSTNELPVPGYSGVKPTLNKTTSTNQLPTPGYTGTKSSSGTAGYTTAPPEITYDLVPANRVRPAANAAQVKQEEYSKLPAPRPALTKKTAVKSGLNEKVEETQLKAASENAALVKEKKLAEKIAEIRATPNPYKLSNPNKTVKTTATAAENEAYKKAGEEWNKLQKEKNEKLLKEAAETKAATNSNKAVNANKTVQSKATATAAQNEEYKKAGEEWNRMQAEKKAAEKKAAEEKKLLEAKEKRILEEKKKKKHG